MKKMMKKLIAMTAALVMIVTLLPAVGAKAAAFDVSGETKGSITINKTTQDGKPLDGAKFRIYKLVGFTVDGETGEYITTGSQIESAIPSGISIDEIDTSLFTSNSTIATNTTNYTQAGDKTTGDAGVTGQAKFEKLDVGIYLVDEYETPDDSKFAASLPFFVSIPSTAGKDDNGNIIGTAGDAGEEWIYDIVATPKNSEIGGDKVIEAINDVTYVDTEGNASAGLGDTVSYKITTVSPAYPAEQTNKVFTISDEVSGLTIDISSIVVKVNNDTLAKEGNYTITPEENGDTFTIAFTETFLNNPVYKGKSVEVTYDATVNDSAVIGTNANENTATIDFGNDQDVDIDGTPSVYVYGLQLEKYNKADTETKLAGVEFKLFDSEGEPITDTKYGCTTDGVFVTDRNGLLNIKGLPAGTYTLKETKTTSGYTLLANPITIEIITNSEEATGASVAHPVVKIDGNVTTDTAQVNDTVNGTGTYFKFGVANQKGFTLPSTGGMGTYLFTIGGIVIMAGAAFALIAMKKRA